MRTPQLKNGSPVPDYRPVFQKMQGCSWVHPILPIFRGRHGVSSRSKVHPQAIVTARGRSSAHLARGVTLALTGANQQFADGTTGPCYDLPSALADSFPEQAARRKSRDTCFAR